MVGRGPFQEEDLKVERSHQKMQELELSLEKQREVSPVPVDWESGFTTRLLKG